MRRKQIIFLVIGLSILLLAGCQQRQAAQTALREVINTTVPDDGPGVVMLVKSSETGEQIFAQGLSNREEGEAARTINHFRVVGLTKTFISTIIIQKLSEGELRLDDTLAELLPDIAANFANSDQITLEQMLMMTSGLPEYRDNPDFKTAVLAKEKRGWHPDELVAFAYDMPALSAPGEAFNYSNTNYLLLQLILDNLEDDDLNEVLQDRILDRVDMPDTYLEPVAKTTGGHIPGYADIDGDGIIDSMLPYDDGRGLADLGLISNGIDLGEYAPALYERTLPGENGRELSLKTVPMGNGDEYGFGIMKRQSNWGEMWGYASEESGFTSELWYLPDHELSIVVLISGEEMALADELVDGALTAVLP
ncbi:MAG: beta-lactamase family protein [Anaerolineae bacterium]|nr:beta-lactamase family protein [Anaerolineae bacterium]